jgi:hypothetical protein
VASNLAILSWEMLAFVFLPTILGTSHCLVFVPLINIVLLLGAPVLPARWVKISTYIFLCFNLCGGTLGTAATTGLLYQPQMIGDGDCGEIGGMMIGRGN